MLKALYFVVVAFLIGLSVWLVVALDSRNEAILHMNAIVNLANQKSQSTITEHVSFSEAYREELDVVYEYRVSSEKFPFDEDVYYPKLQRNFIRIMCESLDIRTIVLEEGVRLVHRYLGENGELMKTYIFSIQECSS